METRVKKITTDLSAMCDTECRAIDPRKEGKLLQEIVLSLKETMKANNLISLTAPQIGYFKRVFCIRCGENDYRTFVNPIITDCKGIILNREKCSSIPGREYIIPRNADVTITYLTPMNKLTSNNIKGRTACVIQHCVAHLDGMTLDDIGLTILDMNDENVMDLWDKATEEERNQVLQDYMASLDLKQKDLEKDIKNDPELSQLEDGIKFMESVNRGETKLEPIEIKKEAVENSTKASVPEQAGETTAEPVVEKPKTRRKKKTVEEN